MDDAEPTMAADVPDSETQSIHAWSQTDDDHTEPAGMPHRRSWKLPLVLAGIATVAVIGAGAYQYWPDHAAVSHPVAVTPHVQAAPPKPQTPDERFIALLKQRNVVVVSPPLAIHGAHETCTNLAKGFTAREIAEASANVTPGESLSTAGIFVATAQEVYCPP